MAWWIPLIGAGMGLLQGQKQEEMQRKQMMMEAQAMRGAPLYGQAPKVGMGAVTPASNAMLQGAMAGAQFAALNKDLWSDDGKAKSKADQAKNYSANLAGQQMYAQPIGPMPSQGLTYNQAIGPMPNQGPMASGDLYAQMLGG